MPEPHADEWRDPPEGWEAYRAAQAAGVDRGWSLAWNGAHYSLYRPGWQYSYSPQLAPLAAAITTGSMKPLKALATTPPPEPAAYRLNQIVTGDARALAPSIEPGSVDLVFTDPVYQNLDDYAWLAEQSLRALRPRGVCLAWASVPRLGRAQQAMEDAGLEYVYTLFYTVVAKTYRMRWYNLFCWTTPCLWFQRPGEATRPNRWMPDTFQETVILPPECLDNTAISSAGADSPFEWIKNSGVLMKWLARFSKLGELVYDPFAGTGSVPLACKRTGRRFYASELLPERAEEARARLAVTPEPLDITPPAAEQAALAFEEAA